MKQKTRDTICIVCCILQVIVCVILKLVGILNVSWIKTILLPFGIGLGLSVITVTLILILNLIAYAITLFIKEKKND